VEVDGLEPWKIRRFHQVIWLRIFEAVEDSPTSCFLLGRATAHCNKG